MRVVIIEDEVPAANRLSKMLHAIIDEVDVVKKIDSVEAAAKYLDTADHIDLDFYGYPVSRWIKLRHISANTSEGAGYFHYRI